MPVNSKRTAMKKSRKNNSSLRPRRSRNRGQDYSILEDRKMLTVSTGFAPATGILTVNLADANETAEIDVFGGNVVVNGAQVAGGTAASSVDQIVVSGDASANQDVTFSGDFSNTGLNSVSAVNVDDVNFGGNLTLSGGLTINASGDVSDADGDDVTVTVDLSGDGQFFSLNADSGIVEPSSPSISKTRSIVMAIMSMRPL